MSELAESYYGGLERGELLIQACKGCGKDNMYPRARCPFCYAQELHLRPSSGRGELYSYTVQRAGAPDGFEDELPYALGVVRLEEGVQVLGRLLPGAAGDWDAYEVDATVELCAPPGPAKDRAPAPWFTLRSAEAEA